MKCIFCAIPFAGTPFGPQCEDLRNGVHVLVCTPGRLLDHVRRQSAVSRLGKSGHRHQSIIEGSLEVKLPTIWRDEKQSRAEAQRRGRLEERRSEEKE